MFASTLWPDADAVFILFLNLSGGFVVVVDVDVYGSVTDCAEYLRRMCRLRSSRLGHSIAVTMPGNLSM